MKNYVLAHGFGFTDNYWQHLVPLLDGNIYYLGDETIDPSRKYIAIGHSLGFLKLNYSTLQFSHLIGLQGFLNFCGHCDALRKIIEPNLDSMIQDVETDTPKALEKFYRSCGYLTRIPESLSKKILLSELKMMKKNYSHCGVPTMIIGTYEDKIVPKIIIDDNFSAMANVTVKILNLNINHTLGFHSPKIVAHEIESFIK
ncbi:MAG: hypothetical protein LBH08_03780 [Puniceicoccales bacterium]|jgi:hypothetical protein|nr:hypothetical protein [Puniceicoccales bacterium]